jgi:hypothetical protein
MKHNAKAAVLTGGRNYFLQMYARALDLTPTDDVRREMV